MRTIIAGSRTFNDYVEFAERIALCSWVPTVVLSGMARGADMLGEQWAAAKDIPVEWYPAYWDMHGKRAGYMRNVVMAENAEALIAFWDGKSRGTKHMIDIANSKGLPVYTVFISG